MAQTDPVIDFLISNARKSSFIHKLILYGSRARGDHNARSDYDLAVEIDPAKNNEWSVWALEIEEQAPTLCGVDLVKLDDSLSDDLKKAIKREGKVIYARQKT